MNKNTKNFIKIAVLATAFYVGLNMVTAQTYVPPNTPANPPQPLTVGADVQSKLGPLRLNNTSNPNYVGLTVSQGLQLFSGVSNYARYYISESGDALGDWAGVELRKDGVFQGGFFKKGGPDLTQQDIALWNRTKPVMSVKQNDTVEFAGPIRVRGGEPQPGHVLTSDATGLATWKPQSSASAGGKPVLSSTIYQYWKTLSQNCTSQANCSCPDGELMVGFMITVQGIRGSGSGKAFCRKIVFE